MKLPIYQVDAFTNAVFGGNPAAVCPLASWLDDATMQAIAAENNLAETAFFVAEGEGYHLRWFTPAAEVDLCGHATLATSYVIFEKLGFAGDVIRFSSRSGELRVQRDGERLRLDFPARMPEPVTPEEGLLPALGGPVPVEVLAAKDMYFLVYEDEAAVRELKPDTAALGRLARGEAIVTAPGKDYDCVSRFFAPAIGIDEDPVTGAAHCAIAPYWAEKLGKSELRAYQASKRGGEILCRPVGDRVLLSGACAFYLEGSIHI